MKNFKFTGIICGLTPLQKLEYCLMTLALAVLPVSRFASIYCLYMSAIVAVVRIVVERVNLCVVVAGKDRIVRLGLFSLIAIWLVYAVSLCYTENIVEGLTYMYKFLPPLVLGFYFLAADPVIYTRRRIRLAFWAQAGVLLLVFVGSLGTMLWKILFEGHSYAGLTGSNFYPLHHAYMAYFLLTAIGFLYTEVLRLWHKMKVWQRVAIIVMMASLAAFVVIVNSRAGVLGLVMVAVLCVAHLGFVRRNWRVAVITAATLLVVGGVAYALLPDSEHRLAKTELDIEAEHPDARLTIYSISLRAVADQPFGYGIGDYRDVLCRYYKDYGYNYGADAHHNAHNQFIDTTVATGIIGLLILLASMAVFLVYAWRKRDFAAVIFMLVTIESLMFEAMLCRQWGMIFYSIVYGLFMVFPREKLT